MVIQTNKLASFYHLNMDTSEHLGFSLESGFDDLGNPDGSSIPSVRASLAERDRIRDKWDRYEFSEDAHNNGLKSTIKHKNYYRLLLPSLAFVLLSSVIWHLIS